jgi:hypothetical protein
VVVDRGSFEMMKRISFSFEHWSLLEQDPILKHCLFE